MKQNIKTWKNGDEHYFQTFYFQVMESPAPLNIPTPTPAPDRVGPVACLSGPLGFLLIEEMGKAIIFAYFTSRS